MVGADLGRVEIHLVLIVGDRPLRGGNRGELVEALRRIAREGHALAGGVTVEGGEGGLIRGLVVRELQEVVLICEVEAERLLVGCQLGLVRGDLVCVLRAGEVDLGNRVGVGLLRGRHVVLELRDLVLGQWRQHRLQVGLCGRDVGGRLVDCVPFGRGIDGGQRLAGRDVVADVDIDLGQRAGDLEAHVRLRLGDEVA